MVLTVNKLIGTLKCKWHDIYVLYTFWNSKYQKDVQMLFMSILILLHYHWITKDTSVNAEAHLLSVGGVLIKNYLKIKLLNFPIFEKNLIVYCSFST